MDHDGNKLVDEMAYFLNALGFDAYGKFFISTEENQLVKAGPEWFQPEIGDGRVRHVKYGKNGGMVFIPEGFLPLLNQSGSVSGQGRYYVFQIIENFSCYPAEGRYIGVEIVIQLEEEKFRGGAGHETDEGFPVRGFHGIIDGKFIFGKGINVPVVQFQFFFLYGFTVIAERIEIFAVLHRVIKANRKGNGLTVEIDEIPAAVIHGRKVQPISYHFYQMSEPQ
jgi:hypothetical protein